MRAILQRLVGGMTGLRHDGRFDEPNLDGTAGDYISFDSWEWPQGVGLYGLDAALPARSRAGCPEDRRGLVCAPHRSRPAEDEHQHLRRRCWRCRSCGARRATRAGRSRCWTTGPRCWCATCRARTEGGFQHDVSDRINDDELWDDTLFMAALFLASYGNALRPQAISRRRGDPQFLVHARFLADPHTGLWFHGWTFAGRHNFAARPVGRGAMRGSRLASSTSLRSAACRSRCELYLLGVLEAQIDDAPAASGEFRRMAHAARRSIVL
jgi:unsaturated rhamnogalacturonyl hydrolase